MERGFFEIVDTESLVPAEHLLRKTDAAVDFNKIYDMVEELYCPDNGRPSVDPVVLFKMVLIQHLYGLSSLRRTAEEVSFNIAYRWFLGYRIQEDTPHFSTISYNFRHRFTAETVDQIFNWILMEMAEDARCTPICQKMYKARKETIERVFADAKEQHGMRDTRFRGLVQVRNWVKLKFAAMNLKKYANRLWKDTRPRCVTYVLSVFFSITAKRVCCKILATHSA